jgi:hypothetical protein
MVTISTGVGTGETVVQATNLFAAVQDKAPSSSSGYNRIDNSRNLRVRTPCSRMSA